MMNLLIKLIIPSAFLILISGCKNETEPGTAETPEPPVVNLIDLDPHALSFSSRGGSQDVAVTCAFRNWSATPDQDWISWEYTSGSSSSYTTDITVTILPNRNGEKRAGLVKFSAKNALDSYLMIEQEADE